MEGEVRIGSIGSAILGVLLSVGVALASSSVQEAGEGFFVRNQGQVDSRVLYYAHCPGLNVYLTGEGIALSMPVLDPHRGQDGLPPTLFGGGSAKEALPSSAVRESFAQGWMVMMRFDKACLSTRVEARGELRTKYNYFLGSDPSGWRRNVPLFKEVVYHEVWPGVDLVVRLDAAGVVCSAESSTGVHAGDAMIEPEGAERVVREPDGSMLLQTPAGDLLENRAGGEEPSWRFGRADMARALLSDSSCQRNRASALLWSTFLGGTNYDYALSTAVDSSGAVFVTGYTESSDFPATPGAYDFSYNDSTDVFVAKFDPSGESLLWCTFIGGSSEEKGSDIAIDGSGSVVVTGYTESSDFPTTPGAFDETYNGFKDVFIVKLDSSGSNLLFGTFLGGYFWEEGSAIALDPYGSIVVTGYTMSSGFPTTPGAYDQSHNGLYDIFVSKFDSSVDSLMWSTFIGGSDDEEGNDIVLDSDGDPFLTGYTWSTDFPTTPGAFDSTLTGYSDAVVVKLDATASHLLFSTQLGGGSWTYGESIVLNGSGYPVVAGWTSSSDFPTTPGAYDETPNGASDAFLARFNTAGTNLLLCTLLGGGNTDGLYSVYLDSKGQAVLVGDTYSSDFPATAGAYDGSYNGGDDVYLAKFNTAGSRLLYSSFMGAGSTDAGTDAAPGIGGNPVLVGFTHSPLFPTTPGAYDETFNGIYDAFLAMLDLSNTDELLSVTVDPDTTVFAPGSRLGFTVRIVNNRDLPASFQGWTKVITPWGSTVSPSLGPVDLDIAPSDTIVTHVSQQIPNRAPVGGPYTYCVEVGVFPDDVESTDCFDFYISPNDSP